jgi:RHS repeat-associated protein
VPGPAIDEPIVQGSGTGLGTHRYYHTNHQGSVIAMSDTHGNLEEGPYVYDPYGNCFSNGNPCNSSGEPYRFTGRRFDAETGLLYYRARYYSPVIGPLHVLDDGGDSIPESACAHGKQESPQAALYTYLPDLNPPPKWDTGNYHANAYAALAEINALSAGAWVPFDVVSAGGPVANDNGFWFNGCYVFTDENDQGYRAAIDRDLPDIIADFVYRKTIVARQVNWDGLVRMENSENGGASPEAAAGTNKGLRSVRFLSFGIRSIAFPEETIREYLTYEFATQALNQLNYNNWQDGIGYLVRARPLADAEFVADAKQREDWRLTDDHLRLLRPIIDTDGSRRWKSYEDEWQEWRANYLTLAQRADKLKWLGELTKLFQSAWSANFRGTGVPQFFEIMGRDRKNLAQAIRDRVERSLFEEWRNGTRAIFECGRVVDALIRDIAARAALVDDYIQKRDATAKDLAGQFAEVERKWTQLHILPGSRERELEQGSLLLREHYSARTLAEASRFSKRLLEELAAQLTDLKATIDAAQSVVGTAAEQAMKIVQARAPRTDAASASPASYVTTIEDAQAVDAARRKLVLNEEEMRTHAATLRSRIVAAFGQQQTFGAISTRLVEGDVRNIIVATSEEDVASAHQRLITERADRVIGVSVIDKLHDNWGDNQERLNREVAALVRSAGRFVVFDEIEQNKSFDGKSVAPRAIESFAVMLPNPPEQKVFLDNLKTAFRNARPGGDVNFITADGQAHEITLVTLVNLFPLRFVRLVRGLRERYQRRLAAVGKARATLEVHTEGDGSAFPDLFVAERAAIAEKLRPVLLLGAATGLVSQVTDSTSGRKQLALQRKDADGFDTSRWWSGMIGWTPARRCQNALTTN